MFDHLLESGDEEDKTKKPLTITLSIIIHVVLIVVLIIIPLLFPETLSGSMQQLTSLMAPPPPPPAAKPPQRVRVGGNVQQANLIRQVKPPYPPLAKQARIQGTVVLEAVISKQGSVENLRVISGHPLLIQAALDAVKQWKYKPTLLNGEPVEVVTTVTVNFNLSG